MSLSTGTRLGPYEVLGPLGTGGMGEVYRARDTRLGRDVAVKVLPTHLSSNHDLRARFEREARAVSSLSHPHICVLHDVGHQDGTDFIVMELVEGETLLDRLKKGSLPLKQALRYGIEIADALDKAHRQGVVHRDLKPGNVMLTEAGSKLMDFGLAKQGSAGGGSADLSAMPTREKPLTEAGTLLGTCQYMSPEQLEGKDVDGRADIWALGCLLYEMATGKRAFEGKSQATLIGAILRDEPQPLRQLQPMTPPALERLVKACLAKDPNDRLQTARDAIQELTRIGESLTQSSVRVPLLPGARRGARLAWGLVALLTLVGLSWWWQRRGSLSPPASAPQTLAVLPFESLGASGDDHFADGITDEVRGKLAMLSALQVIASTSSNQYKNSRKSPQQIATELDVRFLLIGRIRWDTKDATSSRVRVSPELIEVAQGGTPTTRWQQTFDSAIEDVFQVQSEIAGEVARGLELRLVADERQRLAALPTESIAAYEEYLRGNEAADGFAGTSVVAAKQALAHYERAVALDERFAHAWAMQSQAYSWLYANGEPVHLDRAKSAAERALALDPSLPAARRAMGDYYHRKGARIRNAAIEQYRLGLGVAPNDSNLLRALGTMLQASDRWEEALTLRRRVRALDPRSAAMVRLLGESLLWNRRYDEARAVADEVLELDPRGLANISFRAMVELTRGDLAGARTALRSVHQDVDRRSLAAYVSGFWDLYWVLDDADQELVLGLTPASFGDDRLTWALTLAEIAELHGDTAAVQRYAKEAVLAGERDVQTAPDRVWLNSSLGLAYAYSGRKQDAVRYGEVERSLWPVSADAYAGVFGQHALARIYLRTGQPERALDLLDDLLQRPSYLSPGWLRSDPEWKSLRDNTRFRRLTAER